MLSVITCTVNRLVEVELCLESIKKQTFRRFEFIIVDGRRDEKLDKICKKFAVFFPIKRIKINRWNLAYSRNSGIFFMTSGIACFIDDDAQAKPDWLENIHISYSSNKNIHGIGGKILSADQRYLSEFAQRLFDYGDTEKDVNMITGANMSLNIGRIKNIKKIRKKLFNEKYVFAGEETEACLHIKSRGGTLRFIPSVVVSHFFETDLLGFIRKHISYGGGDLIVNRNKKFAKYDLLHNYRNIVGSDMTRYFFPFLAIIVVIKNCLSFTGVYGIKWLPAIFIRELAYSFGIYMALLKYKAI